MNNFILLMGESGSGKTTIANELYKKYGLSSVQSYTTRPQRYKNENGHIFVTEEEFDKLDDYVGYTQYNGYRYCATSQQVEENDVYIIDPNGIEYFFDHYIGHKNVIVIYIQTEENERLQRMIQTRNYEDAINRIKYDKIEFSNAKYSADFIVKNANGTNEEFNKTIKLIYDLWRNS